MDKTIRFETYSRDCMAMQYDGVFETYAAMNKFTNGRLHLRFGTEAAFMTEFGLVNLVKGDWVVEIAENRFITMKDETRKAVFCPLSDERRTDLNLDEEGVAREAWYVWSESVQDFIADHGLALDVEHPTQESDVSPELEAMYAQTLAETKPTPLEMREGELRTVGSELRDPEAVACEKAAIYDIDHTEAQTGGMYIGIDHARPGGDSSATTIMITEGHPHHDLINSILMLTGVSGHPFLVSPTLATGQPFEIAVLAMKAGYRVAREGWNGKGMWICMGDGQTINNPSQFWNKHTHAFAVERSSRGFGTEVQPYILMKTADDKICMGWLASQMDIFATDWCILEN